MIEPTGYLVLITPYEAPEKIGNIHISDDTREMMEVAGTVCSVVALGPDAYDKERFPSGPWCKEGDWVLTGKYAGSRFKYEEKEYRLVNDDQILAVVDDPMKVRKIF